MRESSGKRRFSKKLSNSGVSFTMVETLLQNDRNRYNRKLSGMTTAEKTSLTSYSGSSIQADHSVICNLLQPVWLFHLFLFSLRSVWGILDLIVTFIVKLLSARYFKFIIKSWNFVRISLSLFLLKILREISLKLTKTLTSALFLVYLFSLQILTIYI